MNGFRNCVLGRAAAPEVASSANGKGLSRKSAGKRHKHTTSAALSQHHRPHLSQERKHAAHSVLLCRAVAFGSSRLLWNLAVENTHRWFRLAVYFFSNRGPKQQCPPSHIGCAQHEQDSANRFKYPHHADLSALPCS